MDSSKIREAEIIAKAITAGLKWLGNGDASTPMGAIEAHGKAILDSADKIADAILDLADAIRQSSQRPMEPTKANDYKL